MNDFRFPEIPKTATIACYDYFSVTGQMPVVVVFFKHPSALCGDFKLKPYSQAEPHVSECVGHRQQAVGEFFRIQNPVSVAALTKMGIGGF